MPTMNHEKVNLQKRVAGQGIERPSPACFARDVPDWPCLGFGQYRAVPVPALFFMDLSYFLWVRTKLDDKTGYRVKIRKQAWKISYLAKHILPPGPNREDKEFAFIVDADGNLADIIVVLQSAKNKAICPRGRKVFARVPELDVSIVYSFPDKRLAFERMNICMKRIFFTRCGGRPQFVDCQRFFTNKANFRAKPWQVLKKSGR